MYGTGAHEDSREEQEMPPFVNADEYMQEVTLTPMTAPGLNFRITNPENSFYQPQCLLLLILERE